ncbi:hypothetical protein CC80DRAFT_222984 [Byssothecium circinans]|uniref:Uncharacterized protein n=1 Tax=Byssothecium circinans TaxID=147558 RepID=A0A6A5TJ20_9PLEO|nr:hypothetical protein CC80DRAFT_222984 [Byssothecium circinans]
MEMMPLAAARDKAQSHSDFGEREAPSPCRPAVIIRSKTDVPFTRNGMQYQPIPELVPMTSAWTVLFCGITPSRNNTNRTSASQTLRNLTKSSHHVLSPLRNPSHHPSAQTPAIITHHRHTLQRTPLRIRPGINGDVIRLCAPDSRLSPSPSWQDRT